ncbi:hypothetical protein [Winogradskyella sp. 3972H.M.0a.05]|uniref:hypothetical protein n=1 Tax=Winogradskyella sp. 3972H.M.0a.05 TaxID=2950277 RepID=UPI00339AF571
MKNFKIALLSLAVILACFTSCTNNEPVVQPQQTEESESITTALNQLASRIGEDGNIAYASTADNPTGNIVFDFCFDFVYPIDLSYNNGTTVSVNSFEELIEVLIGSNNDLYVNGIAFPFDVETYNEDSDAIEVVTINNEEEFISLLEDCDFDAPDCACTEEYDPVCVEVSDPSGVAFTITYPNACWAECDGFTEADFVDDCENDYNGNGGEECFTFNFPLTIITDDGETITVDSEEELGTVLYDVYYFDFVYPFTVTTDDNEVVTINSEEDWLDVLEDCYDDYNNGCECYEDFNPVCVEVQTGSGQVEIIVFPNACYAECEGFTPNDFVECEDNGGNGCDSCTTDFDPVCVLIETPVGTEIYTFPNACYAECEGFTEADFVDCETNTGNCTDEDYIAILTECQWFVTSINSNQSYFYEFNEDGSLTIVSEDGTYTTVGTWELGQEAGTNLTTVVITEELQDFNDTWAFVSCEEDYVFSTTQTSFIERTCD